MHFKNRLFRQLKIAMSALLLCQASSVRLPAQTPGFLQITTVEGESALNDVKHKIGHPPSVRVTDEGGRIISGAEVTFTLPTLGPGAIFADGKASATVVADNLGIAHCPPFKPNLEEGRFNIMVTARFGARTGSAVISQSNTLAVSGQGGHGKLWLIVAIVGGGAVGGIVAATHHGGSPAAPAPVPTTLSVGSVTVGGPQ
jgi:hypothetical protein